MSHLFLSLWFWQLWRRISWFITNSLSFQWNQFFVCLLCFVLRLNLIKTLNKKSLDSLVGLNTNYKSIRSASNKNSLALIWFSIKLNSVLFLLRLLDYGGHLRSRMKLTDGISVVEKNKRRLLPRTWRNKYSPLSSTSCTHLEVDVWRRKRQITLDTLLPQTPLTILLFFFPDRVLETQPAAPPLWYCSPARSLSLSVSLPPPRCRSWHRLRFDTRQHTIFLAVGSTHSPCQRSEVMRSDNYKATEWCCSFTLESFNMVPSIEHGNTFNKDLSREQLVCVFPPLQNA